MHFLVTAYDGTDSEAAKRRLSVREQHLDNVKKRIGAGTHLFGAALLDNDNNMIGSIMIVDYPSKEELETEWLGNEPYVIGKVWQEIDIKPCIVPDFFLNKGELY